MMQIWKHRVDWKGSIQAKGLVWTRSWWPVPAQDLNEDVIETVKGSLHVAIQSAPDWAKAWHSWALFNVHAMEHYSRSNVAVAQQHVAPAVTAFFRSVALGQASGSACFSWAI